MSRAWRTGTGAGAKLTISSRANWAAPTLSANLWPQPYGTAWLTRLHLQRVNRPITLLFPVSSRRGEARAGAAELKWHNVNSTGGDPAMAGGFSKTTPIGADVGLMAKGK